MRDIKFRAWNPKTKKMFYDFDQNIKEIPLGKSIHLFVYETGLAYKSLMQFTGLFDKNGKEIFEGDILQTRHKSKIYYNNLIDYVLWDIKNSNAFTEVEIIGNIYENTELTQTTS